MKTCKTCGADHYAKGFCRAHYKMPSQINPKPINRVSVKPVIEKYIKEIDDKNIATLKARRKVATSNLSPRDKAKVKTGKITLPELISRAEKVFNAWIRKRDTLSDNTFICQCCRSYFSKKEMDAGHYMGVRYAATRFDPMNVHGCCQECNRMKYGNLKPYRINLIQLYGQEAVETLEIKAKQPYKWDRTELESIIEKYK